MIRIADPSNLGTALGQYREMLALSRHQLAKHIAHETGRTTASVESQLLEWEKGRKSPRGASLPDLLDALDCDLALVPRESA